MANIKIDDIKNQHIAGSEFFGDNESYMSELTEDAMNGLNVWGGTLELTSAVSSEASVDLSGLTSGIVSGELSGVFGL